MKAVFSNLVSTLLRGNAKGGYAFPRRHPAGHKSVGTRWNVLALAIAGVLIVSTNLHAEEWGDDWGDDSWEEETASPWEFGGFVEGAYGGRIQNDPARNQRMTLGEVRGRLEVDYNAEQWQVTAKGDALYDDVLNKSEWQTRELALSFSPLDRLDIKAGRQVMTWGTGDYVFLNDLFPKDWQSFFSGRDDEYLKAPSDSIKASWFADSFSVDLVLTPEFTPDNALNGERFSFFSPAAGSNVAPDSGINARQPSGSTWSGRLATSHQGVEYALYGYMGYWTTPLGADNQGRPTYPEMNSWGASVRSPLGQGLFNSEMVWYDSREDHDGSNPAVPNSQLRWLVGYEQEVAKDLTAAFQYYLEWTQDYDQLKANSPYPQYETDEYRHLLTTRLTRMTMQQKLTWSLFAFWSPSDKDTYLKPSVTYRMNDNWTIASGANLFYGKEKHTFFGQHEDNSNVWMRVRFNY